MIKRKAQEEQKKSVGDLSSGPTDQREVINRTHLNISFKNFFFNLRSIYDNLRSKNISLICSIRVQKIVNKSNLSDLSDDLPI